MNIDLRHGDCAEFLRTLENNSIDALAGIQKPIHPRLLNQLFENTNFHVDKESIGYVVRDIINMNWWNTCGWHMGYSVNRRIQTACPERIKLIAVQLKEFYRARILAIRDECAFQKEIRDYVHGKRTLLPQQSAFSMRSRANPSQYFVDRMGEMTWLDCTSRATYAAKYVAQNGYIDFDGSCRLVDGARVPDYVGRGLCHDIGVIDAFVDGRNLVKHEVFSQKHKQLRVVDWVEELGIRVLPERKWLFCAILEVRTDPYKTYEAARVKARDAPGLNECLYGYKTSVSKIFDVSASSRAGAASNASSVSGASNASSASDASYASNASKASAVSRASKASSVSGASNASNASDANRASNASDAGCTGFNGASWAECKTAIKKPKGLEYPKEFRTNIFAIAGNWKINQDLVKACKVGWFDPFMGHGTSPMLAKKLGKKYHGIDTNRLAFETHLNTIRDVLQSEPGADVTMECGDSTIFRPDLVGQFDLCYTSPPYFNFEEYGGNTDHFSGCSSYHEFHDKISIPVLRNCHRYLVKCGILALQVEMNPKSKELWAEVIQQTGFRILSDGIQGGQSAYSNQAKRSQNLLIAVK